VPVTVDVPRIHETMTSSPWWTPTTKLALALVGVAVLGVATYRHGWLHDWMPNVVIGALVVALTITVVDRAVRREAEDRIQLRVDDVMAGLGEALQELITAIVFDYVAHHRHDLKPVPADSLEMIDLWLSDRKTESRPPKRPPKPFDPEWFREALISPAKFQIESLGDALLNPKPDLGPEPNLALVAAGQVCAEQLERFRDRDREVMPTQLTHAIDEFTKAARQASREAAPTPRQDFLSADYLLTMLTTGVGTARGTTVAAAQEFIKAFKPYAAPQSLSINEGVRKAVDAARLRERPND
jgi:hypothetical protein